MNTKKCTHEHFSSSCNTCSIDMLKKAILSQKEEIKKVIKERINFLAERAEQEDENGEIKLKNHWDNQLWQARQKGMIQALQDILSVIVKI